MAEKKTKIIDSTFAIPKKRGNGTVRRDAHDQVCRYNLAYINARLFAGDHGRVLGFDNAHDCHHRHLYGVVSAFDFRSFEAVEEMFEAELMAILIEARK